MSAKTATTVPAPEEPAPWNFLADLGRQQMSVATDASCAMIRGFEAMGKIQMKAAHEASARHQAVAQKLHGTWQPTDLIAIQTAVMRDDLESATQYWQQLAATALEMQTEMMGCTSQLLDSETALGTVSALEAFDMFPGVKSLFALEPVKPNAETPRGRRA